MVQLLAWLADHQGSQATLQKAEVRQADPILDTNWQEALCRRNKQQLGPYLEVEVEHRMLQV